MAGLSELENILGVPAAVSRSSGGHLVAEDITPGTLGESAIGTGRMAFWNCSSDDGPITAYNLKCVAGELANGSWIILKLCPIHEPMRARLKPNS